MSELPVIVTDLAYILIVAGITTIIFKRLKQPLVLGYIVAGFLTGPNMSYMPSIGNMDSIEDWGQIGVIFLMFSLGLEFSFKKIVKMGISPIICACLVMGSMMGVGSFVGNLFGWGDMDQLFLGGMLAMSSTTIIYKAFDDMGMRHKKFASNVLSVLILEDILGILLMVVLSAMAATRKFEGGALFNSLTQLGSVLLLWFLVGIYILPLFLKKNKKYINKETLLIVSSAFCFLLVVLSSKAGYSPAFGAFMMGSILSETMEAEDIEHTIGPVKDLFGSVFFVSVGMMVSPGVLIEHWPAILAITVAILIGQMTLGSLSFFVTGISLKDAISSGFSMSQIGEFAFILAALGESLDVTSGFLYPIVVAVSIVTTFTTPYMIKASVPVSEQLEKLLHKLDVSKLQKVSSTIGEKKKINLSEDSQRWKHLLAVLTYQTASYLVLAYAVMYLVVSLFKPIFHSFLDLWWTNVMSVVISLVVASPFLRAIMMRKNHNVNMVYFWRKNWRTRLMVILLFLIRYHIVVISVLRLIDIHSPLRWYWNYGIANIAIILIILSRDLKYVSIRLERTFFQNLHRRDMKKEIPGYGRMLKGSDLHLTSLTVPEDSAWAGKSLASLSIGNKMQVVVAAIVRGRLRINIPDGKNRLFPGDILEVVGDDVSIEKVRSLMQTKVSGADYMELREQLVLKKLVIAPNSTLIGKKLMESGIRSDFHCSVIGIEDKDGDLERVGAQHVFTENEVLWILGEYEQVELLRLVTHPEFSMKDGEITFE